MNRPPPFDLVFGQPLRLDEGHGHWRTFTPTPLGQVRVMGDLYVGDDAARPTAPLDRVLPVGEWPVEGIQVEEDREGHGFLAAVRVVIERGRTSRWAPAGLRGSSRQFRVTIDSGTVRLWGGGGDEGVRCKAGHGEGRYDAWWGLENERVRSLVIDFEGLSTTSWREFRSPVKALTAGAHVVAGELGCTLTRDARFRAKPIRADVGVAVWLKGRLNEPEYLLEAAGEPVPCDRDEVSAPGDSRGERFVLLTSRAPMPEDATLVIRARGPQTPLGESPAARRSY